MISCFSTRKSKMPSVTLLSILNSFELSSLIKMPCLIDSRMRVYFISMYCLKVTLNLWQSSSSSLVRKVVFFSFFSTGTSFLAALRVVPYFVIQKLPYLQTRLRKDHCQSAFYSSPISYVCSIAIHLSRPVS